MRPKLRIWACPRLKCPKIGHAGMKCPKHRIPFEAHEYELVAAPARQGHEPELDAAFEKLDDAMDTVGAAMSNVFRTARRRMRRAA